MSRFCKLALIGLAALSGLAPAAASQDRSDFYVDSVFVEGELLITAIARDVPIDWVVDAIAKQAGLRVGGFEPSRKQPLVDIELRERPLEMVLEFVLGSAGFEHERQGTMLTVQSHRVGDAPRLIDTASAAYLRAVNTFPGHALAPEGRLAQAWLAEQRGELSGAIDIYQVIVEKYPNHPAVAAAEFHTARLNEALGNWRDAIQHYDRLLLVAAPHNFHAGQRLGRARCSIELGDADGAIYLLQTLDLNSPAMSDEDAATRVLVRARAHNALRKYTDALRDLDEIDQLRSSLVASPEYLRNTAVALEGLEMFGPAGRAWLAFADQSTGRDRITAVEMAVELFLDEGDEVSALFAARFGEELGGSLKLTSLRNQLHARLGLDATGVGQTAPVLSAAERLAAAGEAWGLGRVNDAYMQLAPLFKGGRGQTELSEPEYTRALTLWARCVDSFESVDAALTLLREARAGLTSLDNRSNLDLAAAELLEARGLFDRAVDAYGGTY